VAGNTNTYTINSYNVKLPLMGSILFLKNVTMLATATSKKRDLQAHCNSSFWKLFHDFFLHVLHMLLSLHKFRLRRKFKYYSWNK